MGTTITDVNLRAALHSKCNARQPCTSNLNWPDLIVTVPFPMYLNGTGKMYPQVDEDCNWAASGLQNAGELSTAVMNSPP